MGCIGFDGSLNTGLTLRTIRIKNGVAEVRAGATLLHDSDPAAEEAETELKASAMLDAIVRPDPSVDRNSIGAGASEGKSATAITGTTTSTAASEAVVPVQPRVLLVDHEDSFVHTLANYLRQTGANVVTCRSGGPLRQFIAEQVDSEKFVPDLVVLSPGPGNPSDFQLSSTISSMIERKLPMFGVCLGLQGMVEHFGGSLNVLDYPMHGKPSIITRRFHDDDINTATATTINPSAEQPSAVGFDILQGLPQHFQVARYHSLYGASSTFPEELMVTAVTKVDATEPDSGSSDSPEVIMAIQHRSLPIAAVQFHPESILTLPKHGMQILSNALKQLRSDMYTTSS